MKKEVKIVYRQGAVDDCQRVVEEFRQECPFAVGHWWLPCTGSGAVGKAHKKPTIQYDMWVLALPGFRNGGAIILPAGCDQRQLDDMVEMMLNAWRDNGVKFY